MQIVRDLAGYSLGRADLVRRAMGKKKLDVMQKEREIFINGQVDENGNIIVPGCVRNGIDAKSADKIFDEMAEFAKYAFNKSHAAAYAVISYRTAYLKTYYKEELMAATLNSFLGNLDKIPVYIQDSKDMGIQILNPSINESFTKFTVHDNNIRFGLGSIKNVGIGVIDAIVNERNLNGKFESFTEFCERVSNASVNKRSVESLIKAGAFDEFGLSRATLLASFEGILDTINNENKSKIENQVSMFDLLNDNADEVEKTKYLFIEKEEMPKKELLYYEKEMLGVYISGHPLDKYKNIIKNQNNFTTLDVVKMLEELEETGSAKNYKDGQNVKFIGIISKVNKKFTKKNTTMAFLTLEDFYGSVEIIVFDGVFMKCNYFLENDNIVMVEGKLSLREEEFPKIIAQIIKELPDDIEKISNEQKKIKIIKGIQIDITNFSEESKESLRKAIRTYSKQNVNAQIDIIDNNVVKPCGNIFLNGKILDEFKNISGKENLKIIY